MYSGYATVCLLMPLSPCLRAAVNVGVERHYAIPVSLILGLIIWFLAIPALNVLFIFSELSANICAYANGLVDQVNQMECDVQTVSKLFRDCRKYATILTKTSELFSSFLFIVIFVMLLGNITGAYKAASYLFADKTDWDCYMLLDFITFSTSTLLSSFGLYALISLCQTVKDYNELLIDAVTNINDNFSTEAGEKVILENGKKCSFNIASIQVLSHLKKFKGYNAMGFFSVRKKMLTTIFANFVTYFIILMQFRVSEVPLQKY